MGMDSKLDICLQRDMQEKPSHGMSGSTHRDVTAQNGETLASLHTSLRRVGIREAQTDWKAFRMEQQEMIKGQA